VTARDFRDEAQMAGHQAMCGRGVAVLAPALGEYVFFLRVEQREAPRLRKKTSHAGVRRTKREGLNLGGHAGLFLPSTPATALKFRALRRTIECDRTLRHRDVGNERGLLAAGAVAVQPAVGADDRFRAAVADHEGLPAAPAGLG